MERQFPAVVLVLGVAWAPNAQAECRWKSDVSHAEYRECLEREANQTNQEILATEQAIVARIRAADEEDGYKNQSIELLRTSGEAFRKYRTAQCEYEASTAAGGNGAGDLRLSCQIELDRAYIERLKERHGVPASSMSNKQLQPPNWLRARICG